MPGIQNNNSEKYESQTVWSSINPMFNHKMVLPIDARHITGLMQRGFVVEIWDRSNTGETKDSLVGLVKIDMQQLKKSVIDERTGK